MFKTFLQDEAAKRREARRKEREARRAERDAEDAADEEKRKKDREERRKKRDTGKGMFSWSVNFVKKLQIMLFLSLTFQTLVHKCI